MDLALELARPENLIAANTACLPKPHFDNCAAGARNIDPLGLDQPDDLPIVTTERRLRRIAMLAADTGARFSREGIDHDPAGWMLQPRALFDGGCAIDACQDLDHFARATLLHGLSLGLDADPALVDALLDDDVGEVEVLGEVIPDRNIDAPAARLFTCFVEGPIGYEGRQVNAFCAMAAVDADAFRRRLRARFGTELGDAAEIVEGMQTSHPLASLLMSDALLDVLSGEGAASSRAREHGFDLVIDLRYLA